MSKAAKMYATNKSLTAKCLVIRRKLDRDFAATPVVEDEPTCRWQKLGVVTTIEKLAKRYNTSEGAIISFCAPTESPTTVRAEPRCLVA